MSINFRVEISGSDLDTTKKPNWRITYWSIDQSCSIQLKHRASYDSTKNQTESKVILNSNILRLDLDEEHIVPLGLEIGNWFGKISRILMAFEHTP